MRTQLQRMFMRQRSPKSRQLSRLRVRLAAALLLGTVAFGSSITDAVAQTPTVEYTMAENLITSYSQGSLRIKLTFNGACAGTQVRVGMPTGVSYVPGTVSKISGAAALGITEADISNPRSPIFNITGAIGTGNDIEFAIARRSDCASVQGGSFDSVFVTFTGGCSNVAKTNPNEAGIGAPNYQVYRPTTPTVGAPAITNAVIGTTAIRITEVTNGGEHSAIDTLHFFIVYPGGAMENTAAGNAITATCGTGSGTFTSYGSSGDTLFYKIAGATLFNGNALLEFGESVSISEPVRVAKCGTGTNATVYGSGFRRYPDAVCLWVTATSSVSMRLGVPALTTTVTEDVMGTPCIPATVRLAFANSGTGDTAGVMYNVRAVFGNVSPNIPSAPASVTPSNDNIGTVFTYSNFRLANGTTVTATTTGPGAPWIVDFNNLFPTTGPDPDGVGVGLEDLDGDGYYDDLLPGQSFALLMERTFNKPASCAPPLYYIRTAGRIEYDNMCGSAIVPNTTMGGRGWQSITSSVTPTLPTLVPGGQPFTIRITHAGFLGNEAVVLPTDSFYLRLTLPPGLAYRPATAAFNGSATGVDVTQVGNDLYISAKRSGSNTSFSFAGDFEYTCGSSGALTVPYQLYWVLDRSCDAINYLRCNTFTINAKCPAPCTNIGNLAPTAERVNYSPQYAAPGSPMASAATVPLLSTKSFLPYDTAHIVQPAKQGSSTANSLYYSYEVNKAGGTNVFSFLGGTLHLQRGASSYSYPMPALADNSTATLTKWVWDMSGILSASPLGSLIAGDSVWVDYRLVVNPANGGSLYGSVFTAPPGQLSYFYNKDAATEDYCDAWAPDIYLLGIGISGVPGATTSSAQQLIGCTPQPFGSNNMGGRVSEATDPFPGEYRPFTTVDSVVYTLPTGIAYTGGAQLRADSFISASTLIIRNYDMVPYTTVSGNTVKIIPPAGTPFDDLSSVTSHYNNTYINVAATCAVAEINNIAVTAYVRRYAYAGVNTIVSGTSSGASILGLRLLYPVLTKPSLIVQNNSGNLQGVTQTQYWDITIGNNSSQNAANVWFALEKTAGSGVTIDSVKRRTGTTPTTLVAGTAYGSGSRWYQLNTNIASGQDSTYRVYFTYNNCNTDSIRLRTGWNCTGFPSPDPTAYPCTTADEWLQVTPQTSEVQLSIARQPGGGSSISLCSTDSVLIVFTSANIADLTQPSLTFTPPAGVTVPGTVQVEYPLGSGNYEAVTTVLAGGTYTIDLTQHSGMAAGIVGTANAITPAHRQAKIKLDFNTSCAFVSGMSFSLNAYGNRPCGSPAVASGVSVLTNAVTITGATAPGSAGMALDFGAATVTGCGDAVTLSSTITPTSVGSSVTDTIVYTLPVGLVYAGSPSAGITPVISGNTVKIGMPVVAASTPVSFSFDVVAGGNGCGNASVTATYNRAIGGLTCGVTTCATSAVVIANGASPAITLQKPSLGISNVALTGGFFRPGQSYTADVSVSNSSSTAAPAATYIVEAFCGSNSMPFDAQVFSPAVAPSGTATGSMTFSVPAVVCHTGDQVTYRIRPLTATSTRQCLCSEASYLSSEALPVKLISFNAYKKGHTALLEWATATEHDSKGFEVQHSTDGSIWSDIGFVSSKAEGGNSRRDYTFTHGKPADGTNLYRLKQSDLNGRHEYSPVRMVSFGKDEGITIYPNPATDMVRIEGLDGDSRIRVYDITGRLMSEQKADSSVAEISLIHLGEGVYHIHILGADGTLTVRKIVKER